MTIEDSLGDALRKGFVVPTDTMITLDMPLLLTRLSRVPAVPEPGEPIPSVSPEDAT